MKLVVCNGRELVVYDVSAPLYRMTIKERGHMINKHGHHIISDEEARALIVKYKPVCKCENLVKERKDGTT